MRRCRRPPSPPPSTSEVHAPLHVSGQALPAFHAELEEVKGMVRENNRLLKSLLNHFMAEEDEEDILLHPLGTEEEFDNFCNKLEQMAFCKKVVSTLK